ncbi:hypothetical protein HYPSUDRAFT_44287 [Hypholoma sublateritium FD-334 SS-4]|uniref:Uncharacterized protein n=1 Tax=Hypholoma sublateritium (strain FD-334 SS-4) TaxID=945553 RepID=A0A0D2PHG4_HYPSF|nr:hypothetical protein HYPSUDRAFT_44287 [Hypholoma sublateritium FD-334 SS-4]
MVPLKQRVPCPDSFILTSSFRPLVWSPCGQNAIVGVDTSIHIDNGDISASEA